MRPLKGYNIVKEGDFYNVLGIPTTLSKRILTQEELVSLYSGNLGTEVSVSGTIISGTRTTVEIHWGETYDVSNVKYHHDSPTNSGIEISHGISTGTEVYPTTTTASGFTEIDTQFDARYIRVQHSVSHGYIFNAKQIVVTGVKNEEMGFGTSPESDLEHTYIGNSPIGYKSTTPIAIPVYNRYEAPLNAKLSVAPTGNQADNYIFLGTSYSGEYYGINDFGFSVPANEPMSVVSDTLIYSKFSDISAQWEICEGFGQGRVHPTSEGLSISQSNVWPYGPGGDAGSNFCGVVSRQPFTANRSFTMRIRMKLVSKVRYFHYAHEIVFGFGNNMPLSTVSYLRSWPGIDEHNLSRAGRSGACLGVWSTGTSSWVPSVDKFHFLYGDGTLVQGGTFSNIHGGPYAAAGAYSFASIGSILDGGTNYDFTETAKFRDIILTWDHLNRQATGYLDALRIGTWKFTNPPLDGCKIFFGTASQEGSTASTMLFKDFEMDEDHIYRQRSLVSTGSIVPTVFGSSYPSTYGEDKLVDGTSTPWIGSTPIAQNDWIKLTLDSPKDVISFSITSPPQGYPYDGSYQAAGKNISYFPETIAVQVDGDFPVYYSLPSNGSYTTTHRFRNSSGQVTTFSGAQEVLISFIDFYGSPHSPDAWYIDSVAIVEVGLIEEFNDVVGSFPGESPPTEFPWHNGSFFNLKQHGISGALGFERSDVFEVAQLQDTSSLVRGRDFDVSMALPWNGPPTNYCDGRSHLLFTEGFHSMSGIWAFLTPAWVWRRFRTKLPMKAVSMFWGSGQNAHTPHGFISKFKVQYLLDGRDGYSEDDWANVPVIKNSYTGASSDYALYREYFIDNNDGEYYTNVEDAFPYGPGLPAGGWYMPNDIACREDYRWKGSWYFEGTCGGGGVYETIVSEIYLEFDEAVETNALRVVITECVDGTRLVPVEILSLWSLAVFAEKCVGLYNSPIFDTLDDLNTERLITELSNTDSSDYLVEVRSSETRPVGKFDKDYLCWQPSPIPLKDTVYDITTGDYGKTAIDSFFSFPQTAVVRGSKVYIMNLSRSYSPIYYDHDTNEWGLLPSMGTYSENIRASSSIYNHAVILDNGAMYVAVQSSESNLSQFMRYDFIEDAYGISGWRRLSISRPPEANTAGMVGYQDKLYLFGNSGTTIEFDTELGNWKPTLAAMPIHEEHATFGAPGTRVGFWPVIVGSKVFIVGGHRGEGPGLGHDVDSIQYIDVYDITKDSWETVVEFPYWVGWRVFAHLYEDNIIILPANGGAYGGPYGAISIFNTSTNTLTESNLLTLKASNFINPNNGSGYSSTISWIYGGYLYSGAPEFQTPTFRKAKVKRELWEQGHLPAIDDYLWSGDIYTPWSPAPPAGGETLSQKRYFQFRVILDTASSGVPTRFDRAAVVIPQTVGPIVVSGTENFYLKLGISNDEAYEATYSAASNFAWGTYGWGLYKTTSKTGVGFESSFEIFAPTEGGSYQESYKEPCLIRESLSSYKMWYTHGHYIETPPYNQNPYETLVSGSIYYSTSSDSLSWSSGTQVVPLGSQGVYDTHSSQHCCVLKLGASDYRLWYTGTQLGTYDRRILRAVSSNGISWTSFSLDHDKNTGLLVGSADYNGSYSPCVIYDSEPELFTMWYTAEDIGGVSSIACCESADGSSWVRHQVVVQWRTHGIFDYYGVCYPCVIKDIDTYKMWYVGIDEENVQRILYSYSADGRIWTEPVLSLAPGLNGNDTAGISRLCVISNRSLEVPGTYFSGSQIKIYNG